MMKTRTTVETELQQVQFGYWDTDRERFVSINHEDAESVKKAVGALSCHPLLIDAIGSLVAEIKEAVSSDLADIWQRLDTITKEE
jgi:hypothetical protein